MKTGSLARAARDARGVTLIEMLVALVLGSVVVSGVTSLLLSQWWLYQVQREAGEATDNVRGAAALLGWELRNVSAGGGDLDSIGVNSVTLRAIQASAVTCSFADVAGARRVGLQELYGPLSAEAGDSALVYLPTSGEWKAFDVAAAWDSTNAWLNGTPLCFWGDTSLSVPRPQGAVELTGAAGDLSQVETGSGVQLFRRTEYGLFSQDGRWWLGRRVAGAGSWELVTGPLKAPADSGLTVSYFDSSGSSTTDKSKVARIRIVLRAESSGQVRKAGGGTKAMSDTASVLVFLRNQ